MNYYYNKSQLISSVRNSYQQELHLNCLTSTKEVAVTYSASVEEGVTIGCFFEKQATTLDPNSKKKKKGYTICTFFVIKISCKITVNKANQTAITKFIKQNIILCPSQVS